MGSIGAPELIVIALIALLLFGAGRIADIGKGLGQGIKNFKQGIKEADDDDEDEKPAKSAKASKSEKSEKSEKAAKSEKAKKKADDDEEAEKETAEEA
jgi:sec-independent protein translocase protein TatA